ncbi:ChrR family anti-sigma-E factor [Oceaniglobus ichthyenteri]|uniref:ChrR family anti-sigma-E factor n=1 Tax=Oceaniglobus ichthyenteri TaxID=2136177 RepID=UPI001F0C0D7B|nr:ChrR family anti-sigma-E factor [Oceaniglobus ichthyenteri]
MKDRTEMAQINHHLSDQLLIGYAAATLPEAFSLVVATHISLCDECRARLGEFEAVGGALMNACAAAPVGDDALAKTMALIHQQPQEPMKPRAVAKAVFPAPLRDYAGADPSGVKWRSLGGGVRDARLPTSKDATARLLYIPAGTHLPDHGHRGLEMTLVLQGAFHDEHDRFARGDIDLANEDTHHTPIAEDGADCICLAATDAPLVFNGLLQRLAQPFLRI